MGKASAGETDVIHRQQIAARRAAARRAAARRAQMRNRMLLAGGAIIAVVAVALVLVKVNSKPAAASSPADGPAGAALAGVVKDLTSVLDTVGAGSLRGAGIGRTSTSGSGYLAPVTGAPLTSGG